MFPSPDSFAKWRRLTVPQRRTLHLALVMLPAVALGLRLLGLRRIQRILLRARPQADCAQDCTPRTREAAEEARLVAAAARHGPYRAKCLPVALTLGWILRRKEIPTDLRLGVRKGLDRIEAHAWLEYRGVPLIETLAVHERFAAFGQAIVPVDPP